MKQAASVQALQEIANVTIDIAERVRSIWRTMTREQLIETFPTVRAYVAQCHNPPGTRHLRRLAVNEAIETHGVEYLGTSRRTGNAVYYCNTGDNYDATVIFAGDRLRVGCWGDLIERKSVKEREG
jgi:hypothetical protein